jgi:uncharacterized protein with ParB-like and HNH nuclease domain
MKLQITIPLYTSTYRLKKLHALIERGIFAVPELQREFVWSARKACDLLDSIYSNYPIGTVLVWKTSRAANRRSASHTSMLKTKTFSSA